MNGFCDRAELNGSKGNICIFKCLYIIFHISIQENGLKTHLDPVDGAAVRYRDSSMQRGNQN